MRRESRSFTKQYARTENVLRTNTLVSRALDAKGKTVKADPKKAHGFTALWDTGATSSAITQKVVRECGLTSTRVANVLTAGREEPQARRVYLVHIILPNSKVILSNVPVTELPIRGADVLIGMDIISHSDFAVTNADGRTTLSFRIPSSECIDFTGQVQSKAAMPSEEPKPKVARNAPCPCGSGKKYKKCCGKN